MFFLLSKILAILIKPLMWVTALFVVSFFWKKRARKLRIIAFAALMIFSNPAIVHWFASTWEVPITTDVNLGNYRYGVVLGGYATYDTTADRITMRFGGDRINQGIRLLQMGVIDKLIISGGSGYVTMPEMKEALFVADFLDEIGIPKRKVIIEPDSRNTRESALAVKELVDKDDDLLLITSGYHMRRSMACFEKTGVTVTPYSAEPLMNYGLSFIDSLLPSAQAMMMWNILLHEWVGYLSYWVMGYV